MTRTTLRALLCWLTLSCLLPLRVLSQEGISIYSRARVQITPENASLVPMMEVDLTHGTYVPGRFLITDLSTDQIAHIRSLGFEVEILIHDVSEYYRTRGAQRNPLSCQEHIYDYPKPVNFANGSMGGYYTYSEILDALDLMQLLYPDLVSMRAQVGTEKTHEGRSLYWVRISDNASTDEPEPEVLYTALHHAREPVSMMQMIYFMWYLLEGYGVNPEATYLLNNTELYFIPCVNPDGYVYNQTIAPDGGGMWRKNKRDNDSNGVFDEKVDGVDLNRNYGYAWGHDNAGSSPGFGSETYRGPEAFSEPETRAVKQFIEEHDIRVALNYHGFGNYFIYPWGYTTEPSPELEAFQNYVELMTLDNGFEGGNSLQTVGYLVNGCSDDWMYGTHGIYAMTPEIGYDEDGFWPHRSEIIPLSQACLRNNFALAHLPHQFAVVTEVNRDYFIGREGDIQVRVKRYGSSLGEMVLTAVSLSPELTVNGGFHIVELDAFEEETVSIAYSLDENAKGGEAYSFVVILDNGYFEFRDTVTKILAGEALVFYEDGEDLSEWNTVGSAWGITDQTAHDGLHSMTDSPDGPSPEGMENAITLLDPIDLLDASQAVLEFWTKWEVEELIDYAQIQVSTDGIHFESLCGQYSKLGSVFQVPEPVYDGVQSEWVKETIDLTPFVGSQIYLRFSVSTDIYQSLDGIFVDEIRVYVYDEEITAVSSPASDLQTLKVWPNPAGSAFHVLAESIPGHDEDTRIVVTNALGDEVASIHGGTGAVRISSEGWASGLYLVLLEKQGTILASQRVIIE